jgi:four helix bundle protein
MALAVEEVRVLRLAEAMADTAWKTVVGWQPFAREAMGKSLVQAADAIGASLAVAFGRFHTGDTLTFFYYARGSLFETKYWLNRAVARQLIDDRLLQSCVSQLADLARELNALIGSRRYQRVGPPPAKTVREPAEPYAATEPSGGDLFTPQDLAWLASTPAAAEI